MKVVKRYALFIITRRSLFLRFLINAFLVIGILATTWACQADDDQPEQPNSSLYFPPIGTTIWETATPAVLEWNLSHIPPLEKLLEENGTRAFILLKDGKIAMEFYYGRRIASNQPFDSQSLWYWASAGKTLTAALVGIAQHDGHLRLNQKSSDFLGNHWTDLPLEKEQLITVRHQLTMSTGLDDGVSDRDDYSPSNLTYKADAGSRWAYHNAPYTLLDKVISNATGEPFADYFRNTLGRKIGMTGTWQRIDNNNVFFSDARSMARFGLLVLAKGVWQEEKILKDEDFVREMVKPSQQINKSYGYLWWLNGQPSFMLPGLQTPINGSLFPNAPVDMVCGLGRDGQYLCVVPSKNLVLIRMGESPETGLVPITFLIRIWDELNKIMD